MLAPSKRNARTILATLLAGQFMANMDITIVNVAAPSIHRTLHASGTELESIVSGYVLAYAAVFIAAARWGSVAGYGRAFVAGLAGFTLASLACAFAPSPALLVAARVVQGALAAVMVAQVLIGIQTTFSGAERARAIGLWGVTLSAAAVVGQVAGGLLVTANLFGSAWRPVFLMNVPLGAVLLACSLATFPMRAQRKPLRPDLRGLATLAAALLLLVVPLIFGRALHWPAWTWLSLAASLAAFVAFYRAECGAAARGVVPLVNPDVLALPQVAWGLGAYGATLSIYFSLLFVVALYLQQGHGHSALFSGLTMLSWVAAFGLAGFVMPRLFGTGVRKLAPFGALLIAAATGALSVALARGALTEALLVAMLGCAGFGLGTVSNATMTNVMGAVPRAYAADVSGLTGTNVPVAGALGVAVFGTAYFALVDRDGPDRALALITAAYAGTALLASLAARRSTTPPQLDVNGQNLAPEEALR